MSALYDKKPQNLDELAEAVVPFVLNEIHDEVYSETYKFVESNLNMFFWTLKCMGYQLTMND